MGVDHKFAEIRRAISGMSDHVKFVVTVKAATVRDIRAIITSLWTLEKSEAAEASKTVATCNNAQVGQKYFRKEGSFRGPDRSRENFRSFSLGNFTVRRTERLLVETDNQVGVIFTIVAGIEEEAMIDLIGGIVEILLVITFVMIPEKLNVPLDFLIDEIFRGIVGQTVVTVLREILTKRKA